jgi:hypothetical protein
MSKTNVVGFGSRSAQQLIEDLQVDKDKFKSLMILAENDQGEVIIQSTSMYLRDQAFLVNFAQAEVIQELVRSMKPAR